MKRKKHENLFNKTKQKKRTYIYSLESNIICNNNDLEKEREIFFPPLPIIYFYFNYEDKKRRRN